MEKYHSKLDKKLLQLKWFYKAVVYMPDGFAGFVLKMWLITILALAALNLTK
ncbi:hypothetical protein [Solidesulfovibrio alcoholivorans]|uniref:hypothetical protein n=1 Tax=Solidesulfovibrio alcoholivorans TaxID=81406 RepID=UPI000B107985|nr:hypothetical protein [Solidesulfovibrio alcoholivorans]